MSKNVNISIPKPCHENWEAMTAAEKGRFCGVCTKTVFDFTKASDKEIIDHLHKESATCGRFYNIQLNRNLIFPKQKSSYWAIASATIIGFLGIGNQGVYSQVKQDTIQTEPKDELILEKTVAPQKRTITGVVSDELGPIIGASVVVKSSGKSTTTDFDGNYSIEAETGDELVFSYAGSIQKIIINDKNSYNVTMSAVILGELVTMGIYVKKRTFFGRQIQKIRNWFR